MGNYNIEVLSSKHNRKDFDCGVLELNKFLKEYALQNQKKSFVRTYVAVFETQIAGYYSLTFGEVQQEFLPKDLVGGMGRYSVPAIILGRLAVHINHQGKGIGVGLLKNAILKCRQASQIAGLKVIIVHAKDQKAFDFYEKYGFIKSLDDPLTLFFPIEYIP